MCEATANGASNGPAEKGTPANGTPANGTPAGGSRAERAAHDGAADGGPHRPASLTLVPVGDEKLSTRDFKTAQDGRWCPGCGDYAILDAFQAFLAELCL